MFRNIVITILVVSACSGEYPAPYHSIAVNTDLSSPGFQRDDTPLSFQYNTVHLYSSPSPDHDTLDRQPHHYNFNPTNYINIQYAPLVKSSSRLYNKVHSPHDVSIRNFDEIKEALKSPNRLTAPPTTTTVKTDHLEPRFVATGAPVTNKTKAKDLQQQPLPHLDYIPGHNVEVLRSVNRSPGTNVVFKNLSASPAESINNVPQKMVNVIIPYKFSHLSNKRQQPEMSTQNVYFSLGTAEHKNTSKVTTTSPRPMTTTMILPPQHKHYSYIFPRNHQQLILPKPKLYNAMDVKKVMAVKNAPTVLSAAPQQKSSYMKMHTLLLNVARAYNMALAPQRVALHSGANPAVLGILEPNTQMYVRASRLSSIPQRNPSNQKTILYPKQKKIRFAIHS